MFMLEFGAECVPKSVSVRGAPREPLWMPSIGALVETRQGLVALDTGFSRRFLDHGEACDRVYRGGPRPRGIGDEPFTAALARAGFAPRDVGLAAVSHLHCDHSGGLRQLAGVEVAIHQDELDFARGATAEDGYYAPDYLDPEPRWRELDGDTELAEGVVALATPGHTPGHVSFRVDLPESGTWLLAFDAADLTENVRDGAPPGFTVVPADAERAAASLARLRSEQERLDARLVPGHDAAFWHAVRHPHGGHR
jgi:glyoxylase-like metal-dependent hydrolase (beta-lactamase superfamily II)